jgi:hypothetical protein
MKDVGRIAVWNDYIASLVNGKKKAFLKFLSTKLGPDKVEYKGRYAVVKRGINYVMKVGIWNMMSMEPK